jgi:hypothetical protein
VYSLASRFCSCLFLAAVPENRAFQQNIPLNRSGDGGRPIRRLAWFPTGQASSGRLSGFRSGLRGQRFPAACS